MRMRLRARVGLAGFVAAMLVAGTTSSAWVLAATATPAAADSPAPVPVLPGGAAHPWAYLETEAISLLANRGVPTDLPEQSTRGLVRSFIYLKLIALIGKVNANQTLTPQETAAVNFLKQEVRTERHAAALNAYSKYWNFATNEQGCNPGDGPSFSDGSSGMGGAACVFKQMFGNNPTAPQYNAVGFTEAMQAFREPAAARVFFDATQALTFWNALPVAPTPDPDDVPLQFELQQVLQAQLTAAGIEALQDLAQALIGLIRGENAALDFGVAAGALAVILASGIWNIVNAQDTEEALQEVASSNPVISNSDLANLTSGRGTTELFYVVMGASMPSGNAIPPSASDSLAPNDVVGQFPCSWYHDAQFEVNGTGHSGCFGYRFAADPDALDARYPVGSTPPAQTASDPQFMLTRNYIANVNGTPYLSPTLQRTGATLMPWVSGDRMGNGVMHDSSSARNVEGGANSISYVDGETNWVTQAADGAMQGYSSYMHNGAVVTQFANFDNPAFSSPDPNTWKYDQGIRYVDWNGNWWVAWFQDGQFRHIKVAEPVGPLQTGNQSTSMGKGPCNENPVTPLPGRGSIEVGGPDCLFAYNANVEKLNQGDVVLANGAVRVVQAKVQCIHWDQDNLSLISDGFGIAAVSTCGQGNGSPLYKKAALLKPGVSTDWSALDATGLLTNFLGFNDNDFEMGAKDNYAMKFVRGVDFDNCDTTPGATETTTTAGCFVSGTIRYKARTSSNTTENWSAKLAYQPHVSAVAASGYDRHTFNRKVATFTSGDPNAGPAQFSAQVNWGDGNTSSGTVTANGSGGFDVNASHSYDEPDNYTMTVTVTDTTTQASDASSAAFAAAASPRVTAAAVRPPDSNGWYNHSVDVQFTCVGTDNSCPPDQTLEGDGAAVSSTAQTESSPDHSISSTSNVVTVKIDTTAPTIDTATFSVDATSPTGANVDLTPVASDELSGVQSVTCSPRASQTIFPIGDTQEDCHAQDFAGNQSNVESLTVHVRDKTEQATNLIAEVTAAAPAGTALINSAKAIEKAINTNNTATACTNLGKLAISVRTQPATVIDANEAVSLDQRVANLAGTLGGCAFQSATTTTAAYSNPAAPAAPRFGEAVNLTATVTQGAAAVPTGKVQFFVNGVALGTPVTVSAAGVASKTTKTLLPAGIHPSVTAAYLGTVTFSPSTSAALPVPVAPAGTTTWLTITPGQPAGGYVYSGKPLKFTADVDVNLPGAGTPTGTMMFYADSTFLGSAPVSKGKATLTVTTPLPVGIRTVNATYIGTGALDASFSFDNVNAGNTRAILVAKAPTTTKLIAPESSTFPALAPITAKVTVGGGSTVAPEGRVQFSIDGQNAGSSVEVDSSGNATVSLPGAVIGKRTITATFLGNDNVGSSSGSVAQTVLYAPTTVALTATPTAVAPGFKVNLRATLTNPYPQTPIGKVQFYEGATLLGTGTLSNGVATASVSFTTTGTHQVRAGFKSNPPNLGPGSSAAVPIVVGTTLSGSDSFADAPGYGSASGSATGTNDDATTEPGEPGDGDGPNATIWYRWQAPATGQFAFDTCTGTTFDTMLGVYTGSALNALTQVAFNDEACFHGSRVQFNATKGQTYAIQVGGWRLSRGAFTLSWAMVIPPVNDNFAKAISLSGKTSPITGDLFGATVEAGETPVVSDPPQNSVWYKWRATQTGTVAFDTCATEQEYNTVMGVYTGTALNALTTVALVGDDGCTGSNLSRVAFPVQVNKTYFIKVDSWDPRGSSSPFTLSWAMVTRPANDNIAGAATLTGASGSVNGSNDISTAEPDEPPTCMNCDGYDILLGPETTVWYKWTAPSTGSATFDTCSSNTNFDTMIGVYEHFVNVGTHIADNDEGCGSGNRSIVQFDASAGTTYFIQIDGYEGDSGNFTLQWSLEEPPPPPAPANDAFANRTTVFDPDGTRTGSTTNATSETNEPFQFAGATKSVWYTWTAPSSDPIAFNTCHNPSFDTTLSIYTGTDVQFLTPVASNDNLCAENLGSTVRFTPVEGQTYAIQVTGVSGATGDFTLKWGLTPSNDQFANAETITPDNGQLFGSNVGATVDIGEPMAFFGPYHSVWYDWTPTQSGTATIDTCSLATFQTQISVWTGVLGSLGNEAMNVGDENCGANGARVTIPVDAGVTYHIAVDGTSFVPGVGGFFLTWSLT